MMLRQILPGQTRLIAADQIRDWQRRRVSPEDACQMLGVLHTKSWEAIFFHLIEAHHLALRQLMAIERTNHEQSGLVKEEIGNAFAKLPRPSRAERPNDGGGT